MIFETVLNDYYSNSQHLQVCKWILEISIAKTDI
jgi:hypothetical protein